MQTRLSKSAAVIGLLAFSLGLFAFNTRFGGDSLEVWINNKMVFQQFMHVDKSVHNIVLQESNYNDNISFRYSHCGQLGKQRTIALKDANDKVLKQWTFTNGSGQSMSFSAKEIMDRQKNSTAVIHVYYTSSEIPNGKLLVSMTRSSASFAKNK